METIIRSLAVLCFFLPLAAAAQTAYIAQIPDSLKQGANAIVINDRTEFQLHDIENATIKRRCTLAIMNEYGKDEGIVELRYDNFNKIKDATVVVHTQDGKRTVASGPNDFEDWTGNWGHLASDARAKRLEVNENRYPYLIEFSYEISQAGTLHLPVWMPQDNFQKSVLEAEFVLTAPLGNVPRHLDFNIAPADSSSNAGTARLTWRVGKLAAIEAEPFSGGLWQVAPALCLAPKQFEMEGYEGDMSSWASFGKWVAQLNQGRNNLGEEHLAELRRITGNLPGRREKVEAVYRYLQNNSRYVSIQLGLGGWQPFKTLDVHEKKYGDCKALSFYTQSLLQALGIPAYYTLIKSGGGMDLAFENFPNAHFNHALLTVPLEKDTLWLECTSQTSPCGYMGTFTSDRAALLIDPETGGRLIRTKTYSPSENIQNTTANIAIDGQGNAHATLKRTFQGIAVENYGFLHVLRQPDAERRKWLLDQSDWGGLKIDSMYCLPVLGGATPKTGFGAELDIRNAATANSRRLFYAPFANYNALRAKLPDQRRQTNFRIAWGFTDIDSLHVQFPQEYVPEKMPGDVDLETGYGTYSRRIWPDGAGGYWFVRKLLIVKGEYPPSEYAGIREFFRLVAKYDKQKAVMVQE